MSKGSIVKTLSVTVPWEEGLHLRPAAKLVKLAQSFSSSIALKSNGRVADARSILSIMLLCATLGSAVLIEVHGDDEVTAVEAISAVFNEDPADEGDVA